MWQHLGPVPTYAVFYHLGILCHFVIGWLLARRLGLRRRVWIVLGVCYLLGMTVGATVLFDIQHDMFSFRALVSVDHYMQGGLWGGPLGYLALAVPSALLLARPKRAAVDLAVLTLPIPMILAKVGCLMNGCCYGKSASIFWAITFPEHEEGPVPKGIPLHPTQVYEMLVLAIILAVFVKLDRRRWQGTMLLWFLALYGPGRALTEVFRGDLHEEVAVGPVSLSQLICVSVACVSITLLCVFYHRIVQSATHSPAARC